MATAREIFEKFFPLIIPAILIALIVGARVLPFAAYGLPPLTFHEVSQTQPTLKTVTIAGTYGTWISYEYYREVKAEWKSAVGGRGVTTGLFVRTNVKLELTDVSSPRFLTETKPSPFLIQETNETLSFRNITIHTYAYTFKVTLAWSGESKVTTKDEFQYGLVLWNVPSIEDMVRTSLRDHLVPDYNSYAYVAADISMTVDAPTLGVDPRYELNPDYIGVFGMWLQTYAVEGYVKGTACEAQPQSVGTPVALFRDTALSSRCWAPDYTAPVGLPLLTPNQSYWLQNLAPSGAWWKTSIIHLGSTLLFDGTKPHPAYVEWAWEEYGKIAPAIAQLFRIDLGFRVYEDFVVPKIPLYELTEEEKARQSIIIQTEPENIGVPQNLPSVATWDAIIAGLMPTIYVIIGVSIVAVIIYYVVQTRWKRR